MENPKEYSNKVLPATRLEPIDHSKLSGRQHILSSSILLSAQKCSLTLSDMTLPDLKKTGREQELQLLVPSVPRLALKPAAFDNNLSTQ